MGKLSLSVRVRHQIHIWSSTMPHVSKLRMSHPHATKRRLDPAVTCTPISYLPRQGCYLPRRSIENHQQQTSHLAYHGPNGTKRLGPKALVEAPGMRDYQTITVEMPLFSSSELPIRIPEVKIVILHALSIVQDPILLGNSSQVPKSLSSCI